MKVAVFVPSVASTLACVNLPAAPQKEKGPGTLIVPSAPEVIVLEMGRAAPPSLGSGSRGVTVTRTGVEGRNPDPLTVNWDAGPPGPR
jgi:hypothetical protein